jgi:hypothetical protein
MWNFSRHTDMMCVVRDKIHLDYRNTLFSAVHLRLSSPCLATT